MESSNGQINIVDQLAMQRSAFRKVDYSTVAPGESGGATFTRIENVVPEAETYRGKLGEVWLTVNDLQQREYSLSQSTTGDNQVNHAARCHRLGKMVTVLGMDLDMQKQVEHKPEATADRNNNNLEWAKYRVNRETVLNRDLPTTRIQLEAVRLKYQNSNDPEKTEYLTATNDLIAFIDRLTKSSNSAASPESKEVQEIDTLPQIPENWTILFHGSNLGKPEWQGDKSKNLNEDRLVVRGNYPGLSCISLEERNHDAVQSQRTGGNYNTTASYSYVSGSKENKPLEIRIVFPNFHSRKLGYDKIVEQYKEQYGTERTEKILSLLNQTHWRLNQRHPTMPNGTELKKLSDENLTDGRRIVSYVPSELEDIYMKELGDTNSQ